MRKILSGFGGLLLMVVLVAGVGYALFTSTVEVTGMTMETASPGLVMSLNDESWTNAMDFTDDELFQPLLPGVSDWGEFWLKNNSNPDEVSPTRPLDMEISAKLMQAGGEWEGLKNFIKMRICLYSEVAEDHCDMTDVANYTDWMTLEQWHAQPRPVPGLIPQGGKLHYAISVMLDESATDAQAGLVLNGIAFDIIGTQVDPTPED